MKTKINIIKSENPKQKYPDIPFILNDAGIYMVVFDLVTDKFRILDIEKGNLFSNTYDTLEDLFKNQDLEKVVESEITIKC